MGETVLSQFSEQRVQGELPQKDGREIEWKRLPAVVWTALSVSQKNAALKSVLHIGLWGKTLHAIFGFYLLVANIREKYRSL